MANTDNLNRGNPETQFHSGEGNGRGAVENGRKSGEARRRKRDMRETCEIILAMTLQDKEAAELMDIEDIQSLAEANGKNITIQDAMVLKQAQLALMGSPRSFELIRDTVGEKPKERIETNSETMEKLDEVLSNIGGVI